MERVWKKRLKFKQKTEATSVYISRGTDKWWVNSYLFGYWDFDTYVEAERFFLQLTKSIEKVLKSFAKPPTFEDFQARVEKLRFGSRKVVFELRKQTSPWATRRQRKSKKGETAES